MEKKLINLVDKLKNQDLSALGEIYDLLSSKIYNRCFFILKSESLAEDATQDIFLKAFQKISTIDDSSKVEGWLNRMAYNYCIDYFRKNKKLSEVSSENIEEEYGKQLVTELDELDYTEDLKEQLKSEIDELKDVDRTILLMYYWEGYSISEISEMINIGDSAIKMKLSRSREKIKKSLAKKGFEYAVELSIFLILNLV